ncbi:MAG: hypothetical protein WCA35_06345 [Kovacikia sp.]
MLEIKLLSLFIGSLGTQAIAVSGWLRWQQMVLERQREEEEEILTPYESKETYSLVDSSPSNGFTGAPKDLRLTGWEFKIVRANQDVFRNPAVFLQLCDEEGQAGWILLEKLDDRRVRFKRPLALRDIIKPEFLPHDPYRTHYGSFSNGTTILVAIAFLIAVLLPAYLGYALVSATLSNLHSAPVSESPQPSPSPSLSEPSSSPTP